MSQSSISKSGASQQVIWCEKDEWNIKYSRLTKRIPSNCPAQQHCPFSMQRLKIKSTETSKTSGLILIPLQPLLSC